jgi:PAS domain S-box-containing protein
MCSLTHPFYVLDPKDYRIVLHNTATWWSNISEDTKCYTLAHKLDKPCSGKDHPCPLEEVKKTKLPVTLEHLHYDKDGNLRSVEMHVYPILDNNGNVVQVIEYCFDITERRQAEKALRDSEQRFRNLIESTSDWIWEVNTDGIYTYVSPKVKDLLGYEPEELIGKTPFDLMPPDEAKRTSEEFRAIVESKKPFERLENTNLHKDGRLVVIETNGVPFFDTDGQFCGYRGIDRDITNRKQVEEELKKYRGHLEELVKQRTSELEEKTVELEQANIRLQEVDRLKSVFLASMSHELRTPLNSIIGFTGIILQGMSGEVNEEQAKQLTMVKNSASHLLSLINDVLDISKIEAGRVELSLEEFSPNNVVREVVETLSPTANQKSLDLLTEVPEGITLFSDRKRVKQVLMNLGSNAVKYTDQGSVKIAARVPRDDNLEVRVIDTGIGIRKEDIDKLFQPFQQIDESLTKKHVGTGLGLHLSKKLAGLLGGDISAKSESGRGSEFTFTMPLRCQEEKQNEIDNLIC